MIHEVDEGLRRLLSDGGALEGGIELAFDAPTSDWVARRNGPTVSLFLYDIREDTARRRTGLAEEHDDDGVTVGWRRVPRWFRLTYLITAWTNRPQDEHRLLSTALRCVLSTPVLPRGMLTGSLAELDAIVDLELGGPADGPAASDVWSALGGELKPAIDLQVIAPLSMPRSPAGPPVTEGLVLHAAAGTGPAGAGGDGAGGDGDAGGDGGAGRGGAAGGAGDSGGTGGAGRRLRYEEATDPGRDGFAPQRQRPQPRARRRRGGTPR